MTFAFTEAAFRNAIPAIAVLLVLALLAVLALFLLRWLVAFVRPRSRPCPRCGRRVRAGKLDCESCGFDFRSIGAD